MPLENTAQEIRLEQNASCWKKTHCKSSYFVITTQGFCKKKGVSTMVCPDDFHEQNGYGGGGYFVLRRDEEKLANSPCKKAWSVWPTSWSPGGEGGKADHKLCRAAIKHRLQQQPYPTIYIYTSFMNIYRGRFMALHRNILSGRWRAL